jgi:hypothetical protein
MRRPKEYSAALTPGASANIGIFPCPFAALVSTAFFVLLGECELAGDSPVPSPLPDRRDYSTNRSGICWSDSVLA